MGAKIVARRIGCMGENIMIQIASNASQLCHLSLAMDESLNMCDTSQLLVFDRGVDLNVTLELASLNSMHGTVTGEDLFNVKKKHLTTITDMSLLHCLTIDGGRNMCGIKKGLVGRLKQLCTEIDISKPMFLHCITHQQVLCAKYVDMS